MDLRNSNTGNAMIAWATAPSEVRLPRGRKMAMWPMYVSAYYFKTIGVLLARDGQPSAHASKTLAAGVIVPKRA